MCECFLKIKTQLFKPKKKKKNKKNKNKNKNKKPFFCKAAVTFPIPWSMHDNIPANILRCSFCIVFS